MAGGRGSNEKVSVRFAERDSIGSLRPEPIYSHPISEYTNSREYLPFPQNTQNRCRGLDCGTEINVDSGRWTKPVAFLSINADRYDWLIYLERGYLVPKGTPWINPFMPGDSSHALGEI